MPSESARSRPRRGLLSGQQHVPSHRRRSAKRSRTRCRSTSVRPTARPRRSSLPRFCRRGGRRRARRRPGAAALNRAFSRAVCARVGRARARLLLRARARATVVGDGALDTLLHVLGGAARHARPPTRRRRARASASSCDVLANTPLINSKCVGPQGRRRRRRARRAPARRRRVRGVRALVQETAHRQAPRAAGDVQVLLRGRVSDRVLAHRVQGEQRVSEFIPERLAAAPQTTGAYAESARARCAAASDAARRRRSDASGPTPPSTPTAALCARARARGTRGDRGSSALHRASGSRATTFVRAAERASSSVDGPRRRVAAATAIPSRGCCSRSRSRQRDAGPPRRARAAVRSPLVTSRIQSARAYAGSRSLSLSWYRDAPSSARADPVGPDATSSGRSGCSRRTSSARGALPAPRARRVRLCVVRKPLGDELGQAARVCPATLGPCATWRRPHARRPRSARARARARAMRAAHVALGCRSASRARSRALTREQDGGVVLSAVLAGAASSARAIGSRARPPRAAWRTPPRRRPRRASRGRSAALAAQPRRPRWCRRAALRACARSRQIGARAQPDVEGRSRRAPRRRRGPRARAARARAIARARPARRLRAEARGAALLPHADAHRARDVARRACARSSSRRRAHAPRFVRGGRPCLLRRCRRW